VKGAGAGQFRGSLHTRTAHNFIYVGSLVGRNVPVLTRLQHHPRLLERKYFNVSGGITSKIGKLAE